LADKLNDITYGERWPAVNHTPGAATNAVATKAAVVGKRHVCTGVSFSYTAAPAAAVEVTLEAKGGIQERWKYPAAVLQPQVFNFDPPYVGDDNQKVELILPSGGGAVIGSATIRGFSVPT
jgi:hypothetical protein